jgi:hypothetical protein
MHLNAVDEETSQPSVQRSDVSLDSLHENTVAISDAWAIYIYIDSDMPHFLAIEAYSFLLDSQIQAR